MPKKNNYTEMYYYNKFKKLIYNNFFSDLYPSGKFRWYAAVSTKFKE